MRGSKLGVLVVSSVVVSSVALVSAAHAQGSPSATSIIDSLRPHTGMSGGTRGIRPLAPADNAAPAQAPAPTAQPHLGTASATGRITPRPPIAPTTVPAAPSVAADTAAPSVNLTVQFANNSAELTPAAIRTLDELGRALSSQALSTYKFRIEGHTDTIGTAEHNQLLSEQRAKTVVDYLVSKFAVDRSRLEPVGMGEASPLVQTGANVSEPRNRRVKVVNVGA